MKGSVLYMAPDFDAIPEGFEEYLPEDDTQDMIPQEAGLTQEKQMDTLQVPLTSGLKCFVERQAAKRGFSSAEDFIRAVLVDLEKKELAKNDLEHKLREGLRSPLIEADEGFWRDMEQAFLEKHPELKSCDD